MMRVTQDSVSHWGLRVVLFAAVSVVLVAGLLMTGCATAGQQTASISAAKWDDSIQQTWTQWQGTWASDDLGFVRGQIHARLPEPLPVGQVLPVDVTIKSGLLFLTTGRPVIDRVFDCALTYETNDDQVPERFKLLATEALASDVMDRKLIKITLSCVGAFGLTHQKVVYTAWTYEGSPLVQGRYVSYNPGDEGGFELKKVLPEVKEDA